MDMMTQTSAETEATLRVELAAAFRLAVRFDWHESVGNHFSAALPDGRFLLNPKWRHFESIRASDLLALDPHDAGALDGPDAPDPSAWCIHGAVHRALPRAKVLLHCHPPYATALCGLQDPTIHPIDQVTAGFFRRHAIDRHFGGIADVAEEGERIAAAFGDADVMLMGNHGVSVLGATVPEAFETLYFVERAARTLMLAYASGQPLAIMPDDIAERTAAGWEPYRGAAYRHFAHLVSRLDREDASYRE